MLSLQGRTPQGHCVRPFEDWGKLIGNVPSATAILDRFLHHAEVVAITGKSYRLRNKAETESAPSSDSKPAKMHAGKNGRKSVEESQRPEAPSDDDVVAVTCYRFPDPCVMKVESALGARRPVDGYETSSSAFAGADRS